MTTPPEQERQKRWCQWLLDRTAPVAVRDAAAMDLGRYGDEVVLDALIEIGCNESDQELIVASCGEALAQVWLRTGTFRPEVLLGLAAPARTEARALLEHARPDWLAQAAVLLADRSLGSWGACAWESVPPDCVRQHRVAPVGAGSVEPGVYLIPPAVEQLLFVEGLWTTLNRVLGTIIDDHEEERLSPEQLAGAVPIIEAFIATYDHARGDLRRVVRQQRTPVPQNLVATVPFALLRGHLRGLAAFLRAAAEQGKLVEFSL